MTRLLGPVVTSWSVLRSVRDLLLDMRVTGLYLDEVARQDPRASDPPVRIQRPRSVEICSPETVFADNQIPAILVYSPGTTGDVKRVGGGLYQATWVVRLAAITMASNEDEAAELAAITSTAACLAVLQCLASRDARVGSVRWTGEVGDSAQVDKRRSRAIRLHELEVGVADVFSDMGGPPPELLDPPAGDPAVDPGDLGEVTSVGIAVTPVDEIG